MTALETLNAYKKKIINKETTNPYMSMLEAYEGYSISRYRDFTNYIEGFSSPYNSLNQNKEPNYWEIY